MVIVTRVCSYGTNLTAVSPSVCLITGTPAEEKENGNFDTHVISARSLPFPFAVGLSWRKNDRLMMLACEII